MEITTKSFNVSGTQKRVLILVTPDGEVFFKCRDVAKAFGYADTKGAIRRRVKEEDKMTYAVLSGLNANSQEGELSSLVQSNTLFMNKYGVIGLLGGSTINERDDIVKWVLDSVIPSIERANQVYRYQKGLPKSNTLNIKNEYDLHQAVVRYIRKYHPHALLMASLGELQKEERDKIFASRMGYCGGECDLMIQNYHLAYRGLCIEFKSPTGNGTLSSRQEEWLQSREDNGYLCLVIDNYDEAIRHINAYMTDVRIKCKLCKGNSYKYKTLESLQRHERAVHRKTTAIVTL